MLIKVDAREIARRLMPDGLEYQDWKTSADGIQADYLKATSEHVLTVVHENGVHRHLSMAKPGQNGYSFQVTTWPGHIAISGDMGNFTFARHTDMFAFVRGNQDYGYYWAEKCVAGGPREELDMSALAESIATYLDDDDDDAKSQAQADALIGALKREVMCASSVTEAYDLADRFEHEGFELEEFYESSVARTSWRFLWCCNAIADAVYRYDVSHENAAEWAPKALSRRSASDGHAEIRSVASTEQLVGTGRIVETVPVGGVL